METNSEQRLPSDLLQKDCQVVAIAWTNLVYSVKQWVNLSAKVRPILRRLNGHFKVGTLSGLAGPSGSGKTTLLNCLSGTVKTGTSPETAIYLSSSLTSSPTSYYIAQHVHESIISEIPIGRLLRDAFAFKNGLGHSPVEVDQHIQKTLASLMLEKSILQRNFSKCSGGEQKRIAVAQELMALQAPTFLFLDEVTTGLDSNSAYKVLHCLKTLAQQQRITIITSIHAPNDETLQLFDQLYVLAKGGVCIYAGSPTFIGPYLEAQLQLKIPQNSPPIEVLLKIACTGAANVDVIKLANDTLQREYQQVTLHQPALTLQPSGMPTPSKCFKLVDCYTELKRQLYTTFIAKYSTHLTTAAIFLIYFTLMKSLYGPNISLSSGCINRLTANATCSTASELQSDESIKENGFYIVFMVIAVSVITLITSSSVYSVRIKVCTSEYRNNWYSLGVFYWITNLISLIDVKLLVLLITGLSYFPSNQHAIDGYSINPTRLSLYFLFLLLNCLYYQAVAQLVGIIFAEHYNLAFGISQLFFCCMSLFNNFFIKFHRSEVPLLQMFSNLLGIAYVSKGLMYAIYGVDRCNSEVEISSVLIDYDVEEDQIGYYICRLIGNILLFKGATFIVMYGKFSQRNGGQVLKSKVDQKMLPILDVGIDEEAKRKLGNNNNFYEQNVDIQLENGNCLLRVNGPNYDRRSQVSLCNLVHGQTLIAWKSLKLFPSSSLFEFGIKSTQQKPILNNLNGSLHFGTLIALMGASGTGKTSLLRVLNGQCKTRLDASTQIYLSTLTSIRTCFITQEVSGHLMRGLTARQALFYASRLKNAAFDDVDHETIVLKRLKELDLLDTIDTKLENCSGGEQKRLAVALELTAVEMPNLICIDEATSGLDTNSAEIVIKCLHKLTRSHPLTIVTSIHQPTSEILYTFDQLYVLARGGQCIYSGPPNAIGVHLKQISNQLNTTTTEYQFPIEQLIKQSSLPADHQVIQALSNTTNESLEQEVKTQHTTLSIDGVIQNRQRFSLQLSFILALRYLHYIRGYLWKELLLSAIVYLGYGYSLTLFYDTQAMIQISGCVNLAEDDLNSTGCKSTTDIREHFLLEDSIYYAYFIANIFLLLILLSSAVNFLSEFRYFRNEHRNGYYSTGSFYLMKSIFEIVLLIPITLCFVAIVNVYNPVVPQSIYWPLVFILLLSAIGFQGLAHCFNLIANGSLNVQIILTAVIYDIFVMIGNMTISVTRLPLFWQFISNFSIPRFTFEAVMLLQYGRRCGPDEVQLKLYMMSIEEIDYYAGIGMLLINLVIFRGVALYLLLRRINPIENRQKRLARIELYNSSEKKIHVNVGRII